MDFFWHFQCTKVTHKCFKHLCVPTPKCWNEPKRHGGEIEPTENLHQLCPFECRKVIPVFRVLEHWCRPLQWNFQLPTPQFGSPVCRVSMKTENWCWPLEKMGKMAIAPQKHVLEQNFQLPTPLKFGSPVFRVLTEMHNWCQPLQKMGKMAVAPQKHILEQNFQLLTP